MKTTLCPSGLSPPNTQPQLNQEKNVRQIPAEGHATISDQYAPHPQTVQVIKTKRSLRDCPRQEEPEEMRGLKPGVLVGVLEQKKTRDKNQGSLRKRDFG